jgi:uncharacterized transporter HI_0878
MQGFFVGKIMKQQPMLGFLFALITAMAWGSLPIALKQVVSAMNVETIVWYRFIVASIVLFLLLGYKKSIAQHIKTGLLQQFSYDWRTRISR